MTTTADDGLQLGHDDTTSQYQAVRDGAVIGLIDYRVAGNVITFTHTGTELAARGQRVAEHLTRFALDGVRASGRTLVAACPYTEHFVQTHPEYADLLQHEAAG